LVSERSWSVRRRTGSARRSRVAAARVLDVGCGNGFPITDALVNAGYRVVGLDSSRGMLERFRVNLPTTSVVGGDARSSPFAENVFDAAISWGMMFHLTRGDQTTAFANVSRVLKLGAPLSVHGSRNRRNRQRRRRYHRDDERCDVSLLRRRQLSRVGRPARLRTRGCLR
jgi:ubiquinone/menaquinone biosynthesis C-methylase UbiE